MAKPLLVLDLDETLIHSEYSHDGEPYHQNAVPLRIDSYFSMKRPGVDGFLSEMSDLFRLAIWSLGDADYVEEVVSLFFPETPFIFVWNRSHCTSGLIPAKPLSFVEKKLGIPVDHIIIVDDSPERSRYNRDNAIDIEEFFGLADDKVLMKVATHLKSSLSGSAIDFEKLSLYNKKLRSQP